MCPLSQASRELDRGTEVLTLSLGSIGSGKKQKKKSQACPAGSGLWPMIMVPR